MKGDGDKPHPPLASQTKEGQAKYNHAKNSSSMNCEVNERLQVTREDERLERQSFNWGLFLKQEPN